jgi:hypothetical protein
MDTTKTTITALTIAEPSGTNSTDPLAAEPPAATTPAAAVPATALPVITTPTATTPVVETPVTTAPETITTRTPEEPPTKRPRQKFNNCTRISVPAGRTNNPYSNLRQRVPIDEDVEMEEDDETVTNNNSCLNTEYRTRFTIKISVPGSTTPMQYFANALKGLISNLQLNGEDKLVLLPWKEKQVSSRDAITDASTLPTNAEELNLYLSSIYNIPKNTSRIIYTGVYFGHNCEPYELTSIAKPWISRENNIFKQMVQAEYTKEIGWFLSSTRNMDAGALADAIYAQFGIEVGLRWKVIPTGSTHTIAEKDKVRALSVECDAQNSRPYQRQLTKFYQRNIKRFSDYPNGLRLRFVPHIKDTLSMNERVKCRQLMARQRSFCDSTRILHSQDIMELDIPAKSHTPTLRQLIMSITSAQYPECPLFHNVSLNYRGDGHIFECLPELEEEASIMTNTLLPYLRHYLGKEIEAYFTMDTIERCEGLSYDEEKNVVVDKLQSAAIEIAVGEELLGTIDPSYKEYEDPLAPKLNQTDSIPIADSTTAASTTTSTTVRPIPSGPATLPTNLNTRYFRTDDDSISTLGDGASSRASRASQIRQVPGSSSSVASNAASVLTEQSFIALQNEVQGTSALLQQILGRLDSLGATSSTTAGQPMDDSANAADGGASAGGQGH